MFKLNWEKSDQYHVLPEGMIPKMVTALYPKKKIINHELISGGCANLNIKIELADDPEPFILRVYLRDSGAVHREQKIAELLQGTLPVPHIDKIGTVEGYLFAAAEFMPGSTLRDLLLSDEKYDLEALMYDVGISLSKITQYQFPIAGFFDRNLEVGEPVDRDSYIYFATECLKDSLVVSVLSEKTVSKVSSMLERYGHLFPDKNEKQLVHADFDPANILVDKIDGIWEISAILDWEFSFSGSTLCDVANMLRYAHHMPKAFETAFLAGLQSDGITLPNNWRTTVHLLNLLSLLDCLKRSDPKNRPNQCTDTCELINYILVELYS